MPTKSRYPFKKGTKVDTPGGYTAVVVGPDPKDSDRLIIRYTGLQAYLGEDSYLPSQLRVAGTPPETKIREAAPRRRRSKKAPEPLTVYKPASDPETIEQGLKEGWIQPTDPTKSERTCDRCQHSKHIEAPEGKAFECKLKKVTGAVMSGGIMASILAHKCGSYLPVEEVGQNPEATSNPTPVSSKSESELPWKFIPDWLDQEDADFWLEYSQSQVEWQHNNIKMFGRDIQLPRLEAIIGDGDYSYSGVTLKAQPWGKQGLYFIKQRIEKTTGFSYGIGIGNQYRDGNDHIGWHSDDSPEMGKNPAIASLSLGATRKFQLRHKQTRQVYTFELTHGSLFVMLPGCQEQYHHRICKAPKQDGLRINWTFRPLVAHERTTAQSESLETTPRLLIARSQVKDVRDSGWIETRDGQMLNPLHYAVAEDAASIQAQIDAIRKEGEVMPSGCSIEPYKATRKLSNGETKQYTYYRVKAYKPIFEDKNGSLKRSKNLGDANSAAYQDWCQRRDRRERITRLQKQLDQIRKNKAPPGITFRVVDLPQWWLDETTNQSRWDAIPDDYEPCEMYRSYRRKS